MVGVALAAYVIARAERLWRARLALAACLFGLVYAYSMLRPLSSARAPEHASRESVALAIACGAVAMTIVVALGLSMRATSARAGSILAAAQERRTWAVAAFGTALVSFVFQSQARSVSTVRTYAWCAAGAAWLASVLAVLAARTWIRVLAAAHAPDAEALDVGLETYDSAAENRLRSEPKVTGDANLGARRLSEHSILATTLAMMATALCARIWSESPYLQGRVYALPPTLHPSANAIGLSHEGRYLAAAGASIGVYDLREREWVWRAEPDHCTSSLATRSANVQSVGYTASGADLSVSNDEAWCLLDARTGATRHVSLATYVDASKGLARHADRAVASTSAGWSLIDLTTGRAEPLTGADRPPAADAAIDDAGESVLILAEDRDERERRQRIDRWSTVSKQRLASSAPVIARVGDVVDMRCDTLRLSLDGRRSFVRDASEHSRGHAGLGMFDVRTLAPIDDVVLTEEAPRSWHWVRMRMGDVGLLAPEREHACFLPFDPRAYGDTEVVMAMRSQRVFAIERARDAPLLAALVEAERGSGVVFGGWSATVAGW